MPKFKVEMLEEAREYMRSLPKNANKKLTYNIVMAAGGVVDKDIFKKLVGTDIWEFRAKCNGNEYRLLSFWDTRRKTLVVATHGFSKKTQKTPPHEIAHAEKIREQYFKDNN